MIRFASILVMLVTLPLPSVGTTAPTMSCISPSDLSCPVPCRKDLSHYITIMRYTKLPRGYMGHYTGPTINRGFPTPIITINVALHGRYVAEAQHHLACHAELALIK